MTINSVFIGYAVPFFTTLIAPAVLIAATATGFESEMNAPAPVSIASANLVCTEGAPQQPDSRISTLRPTRTAKCNYGFDELILRMTRLSVDKQLPDSVETVEKVFGLPKMTTSYDNPRISDYAMILSGKDGWRLLLNVLEAFDPVDKGAARFVPGLRPRRLYKVADAVLSVEMVVLGQSPALMSVQCVPVSPFVDAIVGAGWRIIETHSQPTDGGAETPLFGYGNKMVSIDGQKGSCAQHILLMQNTGA